MEKDLNTKVKQFHEDVAERGEDVVFRVFPSKIFELQEIIQSMDDPSSPFSLSNLTGNTDTTVYPPMVQYETLNWNDVNVNDTKYAKHPSIVYDNPGIQKINEVISKKIEEMVLLVEQVEVWIILTIPKIEEYVVCLSLIIWFKQTPSSQRRQLWYVPTGLKLPIYSSQSKQQYRCPSPRKGSRTTPKRRQISRRIPQRRTRAPPRPRKDLFKVV